MYQSKNNLFDKTALVRDLNDIKMSSDNHKLSILVLLGLSAAFNTIDHIILLQGLEHCLGLRGIVLNWLSSYLTGRYFSVSIWQLQI